MARIKASILRFYPGIFGTSCSVVGRLLHFFDESGIGVGEDVPFLSSQRAAGDVEVDPQVGVVALHRHADVLHSKEEEENSVRGEPRRAGAWWRRRRRRRP